MFAVVLVVFQSKFDLVILVNDLEAIKVNSRIMNKNILSAFGCNETVAFATIKPFACS